MTTHYEPASGRLRLDRPSFDTLVAAASGADASVPLLAELTEAGVLRGGAPVDELRAAVEVVARPDVHLTVDQVESDGRTTRAEVWVAPEAAVFLLGGTDGLDELIVSGLTFLPYGLARAVGLGPREHSGAEPWQLPSDLLERLLDPAARGAVLDLADATTGVPAVLRDEPWRYWAVRSRWEDAAGEVVGRSLHVTDARSGPLLMTQEDGFVHWRPTTPTHLWKLLTLLLPRDGELAGSAAPPADEL